MLRPEGYQYWERLKQHIGHDTRKIFDGRLIYPRQLEIHLPGDGKHRCNFHCYWCQGKELEQSLGNWEIEGLKLLHGLKGVIPLHVYGGAYTEPMLNPYLLEYLKTTKIYGNAFGIHTNGSLLIGKEKKENFISTLVAIASDPNDYLSISLDAGLPETHTKTKGLKHNYFDRIIEGIRKVAGIRNKGLYPALRIVYLMNEDNSSEREIEAIIGLCRDIGVDSIRFSIPYAVYGGDFDRVREYKRDVELTRRERYWDVIKPYIESQEIDSKPFIFWVPPEYQDVDCMNYKQCIYSYFQITLGADGWIYKCSSTASPSFAFCRLGKITAELDKFNDMVLKNHDSEWNPEICFKAGARCNRMAIELNNTWRDYYV